MLYQWLSRLLNFALKSGGIKLISNLKKYGIVKTRQKCLIFMERKKDYSNLPFRLVLKYYWQVIRRYKVSFFTVIIFTIGISIFRSLFTTSIFETLERFKF